MIKIPYSRREKLCFMRDCMHRSQSSTLDLTVFSIIYLAHAGELKEPYSLASYSQRKNFTYLYAEPKMCAAELNSETLCLDQGYFLYSRHLKMMKFWVDKNLHFILWTITFPS